MGRRLKKNRGKLYRSMSDRMVMGVFGGLGNYLHVKPNWLRIIYFVITLLTGVFPCVVLYLIMAVIIPDDPNASSWSNLFHSISDQLGQMGQQFHKDTKASRRELHDVKVKDVNDDKLEGHNK